MKFERTDERSEENRISGSAEPIPEQPESVPGKPIAWMIVIVVLAIAACGVVVWSLQAFHLFGGGETQQTQRLELQPPAQPFEIPHTKLESARDAQRFELEAWTWADRAHGRVRVPVDVAIDRYLEGRR